MLRDEDLYRGLDEVSGDELGVFATLLLKGSFETPRPPTEMLGRMIPVWREPRANRQLLELFDLGSSKFVLLVVGHHGQESARRGRGCRRRVSGSGVENI